MENITFFPHSGSSVSCRFPLDRTPGTTNPREWNAERGAGRENTTAAAVQGFSTLGWVTAASPGQLLTPGLHPAPSSSPAPNLSLWGAHYGPALGANLVWGDQPNSFTACRADWKDRAEKTRLSFQLIFHTHSLPPPPAILFFFSPAPVATITRNKLINKQLLFQARPDFYY